MVLGLCLALSVSAAPDASAPAAARPPVWGIAKLTMRTSDLAAVRDYYGRILGFSEAFSYQDGTNQIVSFKVSDRQFLEFVLDPAATASSPERLVSVSFDTSSPEQLRLQLAGQGHPVPEKCRIDGAGNEVFLTQDSAGNPVEFIRFTDEGLHRKSQGRFLSERRVSTRIHHVGLHSSKVVENDPFYVGLLQCREIVRIPEDRKQPAVLLYLGFPNCLENVEFLAGSDPGFVHPCLLVTDMQETIYTLRERSSGAIVSEPRIGRGKRWILNLTTPDKLKVEFTEAHTVR